jgi:hypothetical protein
MHSVDVIYYLNEHLIDQGQQICKCPIHFKYSTHTPATTAQEFSNVHATCFNKYPPITCENTPLWNGEGQFDIVTSKEPHEMHIQGRIDKRWFITKALSDWMGTPETDPEHAEKRYHDNRYFSNPYPVMNAGYETKVKQFVNGEADLYDHTIGIIVHN